MAATFAFDADHGDQTGSPTKGTTRTPGVTDVNWKNSDIHADVYSSYPITDPGNSYEIWLFGHFSGAYNLPTIALAGDLIKAFDPAKEELVYCYTGQTSSIATFWLNVLGYKTKGIGFGANRLVYDQLKASKKATYPGAKNWAVTQ